MCIGKDRDVSNREAVEKKLTLQQVLIEPSKCRPAASHAPD
jgi:hypothetical protein